MEDDEYEGTRDDCFYDHYGREIQAGDYIVYSARHGSINQGRVIRIEENRIRVSQAQYTRWRSLPKASIVYLHDSDHVIVVPPEVIPYDLRAAMTTTVQTRRNPRRYE